MALKKANKKQDPYKVLGIDKKADKPAIKRAYRKKAKELHPDKGGDSKAFVELSHAYKLLSDDKLRSQFDQTGNCDDNPNSIEQKAYAAVVEMVDSWLVALNERVLGENILKRMEEITSTSIDEARKHIQDNKIKISLIEKFQKKFTKRPTIDIVSERIEQALMQHRAAILRCEDQIKVFDKVLELLQGYEYYFQEPERAPFDMKIEQIRFGRVYAGY